MEKASRNDKKNCKRIITKLSNIRPTTEKETKRELAFCLFLSVLVIFVPMFGFSFLMGSNRPVLAFLISTVSIVTGLLIGIGKRRKFLRAFYQTRDAHRLVSIESGNDQLEEFLKIDEVLISAIPQKDAYIDVLYNWLCWRKLIYNNEPVTWYTIDYDRLKPFLNEASRLCGQEKVLLMIMKGRLPDNAYRFYNEAKYLGVNLLNNIKA